MARTLALGFALAAAGSPGQGQTTTAPWRHTLVLEATLTDDCLICGRPALVLPMRGGFDLRLVEENPLFTTYAVEAIDLSAGFEGGPRYRLTGRGEYQVGGEVAVTQKLTLALAVDDGSTIVESAFASEFVGVKRAWPMILVPVKQTDGTPLRQLDLTIASAPFRDLWFSTNHGMTSGTTPPPFVQYSGGDLLSLGGGRVKTNGQLTAGLGIMPMVPDVGLDAVDVQPGGEVAFSMTQDIFSESLGPLGHGDLVSNQGRLLRRHADLLAAFGPMPPLADAGLDAVQALDGSVLAFSLTTEVFSERLGRKLGRGDLLSSAGAVLKTNQELLSRFQPVPEGGSVVEDLGLDAVHVWPGGEIWFSTERPFQDKQLGPVRAGDLLSDQGYIVFGNLDLVAAFSPLEDLADFGLDGLVLVTDAVAPLPPPIVTAVILQPEVAGVRLEWQGDGRFFQVLGAPGLTAPFTPMSAIQPDANFDQSGLLRTHPDFYFKVRQW
jgi:hypothetical protein